MEIFKETVNNKIGVLKVTGRLDASAVKKLKENVNSMITSKITCLVLDMSGVNFIDSSGLGSLVSCLRMVNSENGDIRLAALQDQIRSLIELTRLHRVFQIFEDRNTAVNSF